MTARLRQGGQTYRQRRLREGEWEGRRAGEGRGTARQGYDGEEQGAHAGRAGAAESANTRTPKKKKKADTQEGHVEEAGRGRWGEQGANKGAKEDNVSHRGTPCR